jgi:predicted HTH transcriptional regulator
MNYTTIIIIAVIGIIIGYLLARRQKEGLIFGQAKRKQENKQKILDFLQENRKIQNNDVEKLSGVSNATAERYLNELEKAGKITQHGKIGQNVFYTLK